MPEHPPITSITDPSTMETIYPLLRAAEAYRTMVQSLHGIHTGKGAAPTRLSAATNLVWQHADTLHQADAVIDAWVKHIGHLAGSRPRP